MNKKLVKLFAIVLTLFIVKMNCSYAATYLQGTISGTGVYTRKGPGTNYDVIKTLTKNAKYRLVSNELYPSEKECEEGWYKIFYSGIEEGYVCAKYLIDIKEVDESESTDMYLRPWTSPKSAITGGAIFITESYINKGQFTSYLKKFNVNPNGYYSVYNHQYMANLAAPYSEAYSSYNSYLNNNLLELPLEFTIPVFENMPDYTTLPGKETLTQCQTEVLDEEFENVLNFEGFPESYKCKLRLIHNTYSNWSFKALQTGLDFAKSVNAEQAVSSIQGGDIYYDLSSGGRIQTEKGWYKANKETVGFYLDPRNSLVPERILMFENLAYSDNYTTSVVQNILNGTFMAEYSLLDNESYASIFVEAGKKANISSVYLASLARQESGTKGSKATSGEEFTYKGVTYRNLYNFFNIGASSSAESPVLAGLVWASGGDTSVIVINEETPTTDNTEVTETNLIEEVVLTKLKAVKQSNILTNINIGTTLKQIKDSLENLTVTIEGLQDGDILKTGQELVITDGTNTVKYVIAIKGDVDGDGAIEATDYVKIKNYIMEKAGSELSIAQSVAADVDGNSEIGATDYVKIKNSIMER